MSHKAILFLVFGSLLGAVNGAIVGTVAMFLVSASVGLDFRNAILNYAVGCSIVGIVAGYIGSVFAALLEREVSRVAYYVVCGVVVAFTLFVPFSEWRGAPVYALTVGSATGLILSLSMIHVRRLIHQH